MSKAPTGMLSFPPGTEHGERARIALDRVIAHARALDGAELDETDMEMNELSIIAACNALDVVAMRRRNRGVRS